MLSKQEFLDNLYARYQQNFELQKLAALRRAEEEQLVIDFQVQECNAARDGIRIKYETLGKPHTDALKQL